MVCTYRVRTDMVEDEERRTHTVYGIEAVGEGGETLSSFSDVFAGSRQAERFAGLCNDGGLPLMHFSYAVVDALAE